MHNLILFGRQADRQQLNETNCPLLSPLCLPEAGACLIPNLPQRHRLWSDPLRIVMTWCTERWAMALVGFCSCTWLCIWFGGKTHAHIHTILHIIWGVCYCNTVIHWGQLYTVFQIISLSFHSHEPTSTHMHGCFVFSNGVPLDAAELDDCVYLFWGAAPRPKSALICYSFFDSSAMVGCLDGRPDYSIDTDSDRHSLFSVSHSFFCCMMGLISLMDVSEWICTSCSLCQTDVIILHWLLALTPSFSTLPPVFSYSLFHSDITGHLVTRKCTIIYVSLTVIQEWIIPVTLWAIIPSWVDCRKEQTVPFISSILMPRICNHL